MTDLLLQHLWLAPTALALLVLLGPIAGRWLTTRPRAAWLLLGLSLVPVLVTTLVPIERRLYAVCTVQWSWPTLGRVELLANVVLFVAPALLLTVAIRRPVLAALAGSALSAAIEALQALVPAIGRSCDTTDWSSNTIGAVLGVVLGWVAVRWSAAPARPERDVAGR